jgi:hypothetical protein
MNACWNIGLNADVNVRIIEVFVFAFESDETMGIAESPREISQPIKPSAISVIESLRRANSPLSIPTTSYR